jgi:hypothetical protein
MNQRAKEGLRLALLVSLVAMVLAGCGKNVNRVVPTPPTVPSQPLRDVAVIGPVDDIRAIHIQEMWDGLHDYGSVAYDLMRANDDFVGRGSFSVTARYTGQHQTRLEDVNVSVSDVSKLVQAISLSTAVPLGAIAGPTPPEGTYSLTIFFDLKDSRVFLNATTEPWLVQWNQPDTWMLNSRGPRDAYDQLQPSLKGEALNQLRDLVSRPLTPTAVASPTSR